VVQRATPGADLPNAGAGPSSQQTDMSLLGLTLLAFAGAGLGYWRLRLQS
jgi:hypothetical protein